MTTRRISPLFKCLFKHPPPPPRPITTGRSFFSSSKSNSTPPPPPSYYSFPPTPPTPRRSPSSLVSPILFCTGVSVLSFSAAAYYTNYDTSRRLATISSRSSYSFWTSSGGDVEQSLSLSRIASLIASSKKFVNLFPPSSQWPTILVETWLGFSESQRTCFGIIGLQLVVFAGWRIPRVRIKLGEWFLSDPTLIGVQRGKIVTMLTSVFSHMSATHILFNSIALFSIGPPTCQWLQSKLSRVEDGAGPRSTSRYEFIAFFIAAGLVSSLTSHLWTVFVLLPRLGAAMMRPSLGASGAIYGCLSITALAFPDSEVALIFLPWVPLPIGTAYWGMVALDVLGLLRGWRLFDHAAHLGGAFAGIAYFMFGHHAFERFRAWMKGSKTATK